MATTFTHHHARADRHGNVLAREGCDRCTSCGCKYWELDRCVDCGEPFRFAVAVDRSESEPCEAGTVGCCVEHRADEACQTW